MAELLYTEIPQSIRDRWDELSDDDKEFLSGEFNVRAVIAIREDRLSWLNSLKTELPAILHKRFELKGFTDEQAREAIVQPAALPQEMGFLCHSFSYSDEALQTLLSELKKGGGDQHETARNQGRIEAFLLQICCESIERQLIERAKQGNRDTEVGPKDLPRFDRIYEEYYHNKIMELPPGERDEARLLIEDELVSLNEATGVVFRLNADGRKLTAKPGVTEALLKKLTHNFLLRAEPNTTGGFNYEISHDTLVAPVLKAREQRLAEERRHAEAAASEARERELAHERQRRRRANMIAVGGVLLALIATGASIYAWQANNKAQRLAHTSQLVSRALQLADNDATAAFQIINQALALSPDHKTALQARHDIYAENEFYDRVINCSEVEKAIPSPDGSLILAIAGRQAILYDTTGKEMKRFDHPSRVIDAAFYAGSQRILTASLNDTAYLWNKEGQQLLQIHFGHIDPLQSIACSSNGSVIALGGANGFIGMYNAKGELQKSWKAHEEDITDMVFSPKGDAVLTASKDKKAHLWQLDNYKRLQSYLLDDWILAVDISPGGDTILTADRDGLASLWRKNGELLAAWVAHDRRINSACFSPDGLYILTASDDQKIKLWDGSGRQQKIYRGHEGFVYYAAFFPDGNSFLSAGEDQTIKRWKTYSKLAGRFSTGSDQSLSIMHLSPDGKYIITAAGSAIQAIAGKDYDTEDNMWESILDLHNFAQPQSAFIWDTAGNLLHTLSGHDNFIEDIAVSNDGSLIATGSNKLILWNINGSEKEVLKSPQGSIFALAIAPDNRFIAFSQSDSTVVCRNPDGKEFYLPHPGLVSDLCFSPDGKRLLTGCYDDNLRIWDISGKHPSVMQTMSGKEGRIESVAWSPDGRYVAMGESGLKAKLTVFNVEGNQMFERIFSAENKTGGRAVNCITFSPDSRLVAAGAEGGVARIFNLSGADIQRLEDFNDEAINGVAFSPDGRWLWVGSRDGVVHKFGRLAY
ncbi:MAG: WD40 repeat domain-containing protein [Saprospiraceae bacterium]|nr:WD40 repeat domain-containing protein [Saprospiraceae bacterium]